MKRPMTTEELFNRIKSTLKAKNKLPDILDYGLATSNPVPIRTYQFDLKHNLAYGGSEGIYLDLWIEYFYEDENYRKDLGTFKTLQDSKESMHAMAALLADFIIELNAYVRANEDDFAWEGIYVYPIDGAGKRVGWWYSCSSMERALEKKDKLLEEYPQVAIRDNATRKEKIFCRDTEEKKDVLQSRGSGV